MDFPDDVFGESFIHQILQDDMLKKLVTAVRSLSKGIMLTKNIKESRHDMPNVGACVFEVDVVFDRDQFSVIRKVKTYVPNCHFKMINLYNNK